MNFGYLRLQSKRILVTLVILSLFILLIFLFFSDSLAMTVVATVHTGHRVSSPLPTTLHWLSFCCFERTEQAGTWNKLPYVQYHYVGPVSSPFQCLFLLFWIQILLIPVCWAAPLGLLCICHDVSLAPASITPAGNLPHTDPTFPSAILDQVTSEAS